MLFLIRFLLQKMGLKAREIIEEPKKIYFDPHETYVVLNVSKIPKII